jgi:UDP-N-acetylglucosamine 2-epimerase (non-hydrolysing)
VKSAFILGTRPEIIKLSPVIREHLQKKIAFKIIHTNQHYSPELDKVFFEQLHLPAPDYNLGVGSGTHGEQIGRMLETLEPVLVELMPEVVFVEGDTNSVLAGGLMASRLGIPVAHVEAGLRSYDRRMPEELNRILVDHLSDYLFAPTDLAREIMLGEGLPASRIYVTGNTVVDALYEVSPLIDKLPGLEERWRLTRGAYILVTLHRPENVDSVRILTDILEAIDSLGKNFSLTPVFPVHPRTARRLAEFGIALPRSFLALGAIDYFSFLQLEKNARLVVTDSGGVQEEACIFGVPCVTVRLSTERPETVKVGANIVAGVERETVIAAGKIMMERKNDWTNPFGDGRAGERIVEIIADSKARRCNRP